MNEPIKPNRDGVSGSVSPPAGVAAMGEPAEAGSGFAVGICIVAAIGGFLFGFDSGVINGAIGALEKAFGTASATTGFAVASVLLGSAVGAFAAGPIANAIGRRLSMLLSAFVFLVSSFGAGASSSAGIFFASRIGGGLAIGAASILAPMYISEVAPAHLRGRLASLQQLAIVLGLFCAFLSNAVLTKMAGGAAETLWAGAAAWRWMFWMLTVPSIAFLLGTMLIPESPRFLIIHGKQERAKQIFARIGENGEEMIHKVRQSLKGAHRPRASDLFTPGTRRLAPVVWVGVGLAAFQQFVGINIIFYYGEVLWQAAGATEQSALAINLLTGFVNILATVVAILFIDRAGRKPLLLMGSVGMALTLGVMAVVFFTAHVGAGGKPVLTHGAALTGLIAANLYIVSFGASWGPVMWVLLGEMFPNRLRGAAMAVAGATNWIANFVVTVTFLPLLNAIGLGGAYAIYAAAAVVSLPFVWAFVRETKGKTLEEMSEA